MNVRWETVKLTKGGREGRPWGLETDLEGEPEVSQGSAPGKQPRQLLGHESLMPGISIE